MVELVMLPREGPVAHRTLKRTLASVDHVVPLQPCLSAEVTVAYLALVSTTLLGLTLWSG